MSHHHELERQIAEYFQEQIDRVSVPEIPDLAGRKIKSFQKKNRPSLLRVAAVFIFLAFLSPLFIRGTWESPLAKTVSAYCAANNVHQEINRRLYKAHVFLKKYYLKEGIK